MRLQLHPTVGTRSCPRSVRTAIPEDLSEVGTDGCSGFLKAGTLHDLRLGAHPPWLGRNPRDRKEGIMTGRRWKRSLHASGVRKSVLGRLAIVAVACSVVAACGGSTGASTGGSSGSGSFAGQTLTVAMGPTTGVPGEAEFNNMVATAFHKATGATIKYDYNVTDVQAEQVLIDTAAVSNSGPDVIQLGDTINAAAYAVHGFQALTQADWAVIGGRSTFWPATMGNSGPSADQDILVPQYVDPTLMVYNTKLFAQAGIDSPPTTWTDFVRDAQKINDPAKGIYGTDWYAHDLGSYKALYYFAADNGGQVVSSDLKSAQLTTQPWVKALQFWFGLQTQFHVVPPNTATNTQAQYASQFADGNIGEEVASSASYNGTYEAGKIGKSFAFAPLPTMPYGQSTSAAAHLPTSMDLYEGLVIAKSAPKALALQYLKIVTSDKYELLHYKLGGFMPSKIVAANQAAKLNPGLIGPQILAEEGAQPVPFIPAFGTFESALGAVTTDASGYLATHGNVPASEFQQLLTQANSTVQAKL